MSFLIYKNIGIDINMDIEMGKKSTIKETTRFSRVVLLVVCFSFLSFISFLSFLSFLPTSLFAQGETKVSFALLPLVTNVDRDKLRVYKKDLSSMMDSLFKTCSQEKIDASEFFPSENLLKKVSKISFGKSQTPYCKDIVFEPVWLDYEGSDYLFLNVLDFKNTLIYQTNRKLSFSKDQKDGSIYSSIGEDTQRILEEYKRSSKINLYQYRVKTSVGSYNKNKYLLFDLIMEQVLLDRMQVRVVHGLSRDYLELISQYVNKDSIQNRASRNLLFSWYQDKKQDPSNSSSNSTVSNNSIYNLKFNLRVSESVFSNHVQTLTDEPISFTIDQQKLKLTGSIESLAQIMDLQKKELLGTDPQVVKVDRAWVYLDKGRASGLKIYDRLIIGDKSYGHVIGYYGSDMGLVSEQGGYPISEGAIVYVRKGQHDVRVGQSVKYDPAQYPKYP